MRTLLATLVLCLPVFGGQAFLTPTSPATTVNITWPTNFPALQNAYLEIGVDIIGTCSAPFGGGDNVANFVSVTLGNSATHRFGIGCNSVNTKAVSITADNGGIQQVLSDSDMTGVTTAVFRHTRDFDANQKVFEAFRTDGTLIGSVVKTNGNANGATQICTTAPCTIPVTRPFMRPNGMVKIRWARLYTGKPSQYGVLVPKDSFATVGDLFNFNFEGNLTDTSPRALALSSPAAGCPGAVLSGCFTTNNTFSNTVVQASVSSGSAGGTITLDATQSFRWDDTSPTVYEWRTLSAPAEPIIHSPLSGSSVVSRLVEGPYSFEFKVDSEDVKVFSTNVTNLDLDGLPLYPSNSLTGGDAISCNIAGVSTAVDVRINVRKPDGNLMTPTVCTACPCAIPEDNRQANHTFMKEYRNGSGVVLSKSDWQEFPMVSRIAQPNPYMANGGNTYVSPGDYLTFDLIHHEPSRKFLSKRLRVTAENGLSPVGEWADWSRAHHTIYKDSRAEYPYEMPDLRNIAAARGFDPESMVLHSEVNYAFMWGVESWRDMERFDIHQTNNGAFLWNGSALTNVSTAAFDTPPAAFASDVVMTSSNNELYLGYGEAIDRVYFKYSTPRTGGTVTYSYSTGAGTWSPITPVSDTTNGLTSTGEDKGFIFTPPVNWARVNYGSSIHPQFWVKITIGGSPSQYPRFDRVYTDDWRRWDSRVTLTSTGTLSFIGTTPTPNPYVNGHIIRLVTNASCPADASATVTSINLNGLGVRKLYTWRTNTTLGNAQENGVFPYSCASGVPQTWMYDTTLDGGVGGFKLWVENRGWCLVDGSGSDRITSNDGTWTYDPTPGPNCSARFQYQSRILFGWAPNNFSADISDVQAGQTTRARYITELLKPQLAAIPKQANGIYLDDVDWPQPDPGSLLYPTPGMDILSKTEQAIAGAAPTRSQTVDRIGALTAKVLAYQREDFPGNKVIQNSHTWRQTSQGTGALYEFGMHAYANYNWRYTINPDPDGPCCTPDTTNPTRSGFGGEGYDRYHGANAITASGEPSQTIHTILDTTSEFFSGGVFKYWDRGNRGPMHSLGLYYMGASENTSMAYIKSAIGFYFHSDEYTYWDAAPDVILSQPLAQALNTSALKTLNGDFSAFPSTATAVQIINPSTGEKQRVTITKTSATTATTTTDVIGFTFPIGSTLHIHKLARAAELKMPPSERIYTYSAYFPARDIDVGVADTSSTALLGDANTAGIPQRGFRKLNWYPAGTGAGKSGLITEVARRDLTKAIIIMAVGCCGNFPTNFDTYSQVLDVNDANGNPINFWPLKSDGTTNGNFCGPGVTVNSNGSCPGKIRVRPGESVIGLKAPIN